MVHSKHKSRTAEHDQNTASTETGPDLKQASSSMSKSMHDGVEVWCDCCSCEAEPYWTEAMQAHEEGS